MEMDKPVLLVMAAGMGSRYGGLKQIDPVGGHGQLIIDYSIYDALRDALGLTGKKKTSADGLFTLETVACLGACGLAPVMTLDGEVHAKMTPEDALALVEEIRKKEGAAQ